MKVLIAEDDPNTREGLRDILETEGYEVLTAPDGQKALETYRVEKPQVLCLDIMMPQVNGYDVCREIRRTDSRTPILFISAKSEEIDKVLGLEIGADDFIVKPFGVKEVVARIRAVTRRTLAESPTSDKPRDYSFTMDELR
ncbi:MAG: response regulator, partial [Opitutae bacterium]|nr:response regulator [Opitutae bacterium]